MKARLCLPAMNDVNPDLTFTAEVAEDFGDRRLPTLDFSLWMKDDMSISHSYYAAASLPVRARKKANWTRRLV